MSVVCFFTGVVLEAVGASEGSQTLMLIGWALILAWAIGLGVARRYGR
jgi:hypothetical protein